MRGKILGLEPVAFAEIDKYASAVLAAHYPTVPNLGDVSSIDWNNYRGNVDIVALKGSPVSVLLNRKETRRS